MNKILFNNICQMIK